MGGGDRCMYVGIDVGYYWVMAARISSRRLFTLILVGLVLPDFLVSCVLNFDFCALSFAKSIIVN